jgi:hypothetical protein
MRNIKVQVMLNEVEYRDLKDRAGDVSLSRYCRKALLGNSANVPAKTVIERSRLPVVEVSPQRTAAEAVIEARRKKWRNKYCPGHHILECGACE